MALRTGGRKGVVGEGGLVSRAAGVSLGHSGSGVGIVNWSQAESITPAQINIAHASQALALSGLGTLHLTLFRRDREVLPELEALPESTQGDIRDLKARLRRLGSINPNAPQEYHEVKERHDFLSSQMTDLDKSSKSLQQVIQELDQVMEKEFPRIKWVNAETTPEGSRVLYTLDEKEVNNIRKMAYTRNRQNVSRHVASDSVDSILLIEITPSL